MNAAIYVMRGEHRDALEQLVRTRGWNLDVFEDSGRRRDRRPGLRALLAGVRARRVDAVVVYRASTFARTLDELVTQLALLRRAGVRFVSTTEAFDTMSFDEIVEAFIAFKRAVIGDRTREGMRRGRQLGRPRAGLDDTIIAMRSRGHSFRAIADELRVGKGTVQRALDRTEVDRKGSLH